MQTTFSAVREDTLPIACDLGAIDAESRSQHLAHAAQLLSETAHERQDIPDGYAFRYTADQYLRLVEFIANERLCCPFFQFVLEISPAQGPIWLRITGGEGVKDFLRLQLLEN